MLTNNVLVVSDDDAWRIRTCERLDREGIAVAFAGGGPAALERLRTHSEKPGVILLDLTSPGLGSWEFRIELLRDPQLAAIPVVLATAGTNDPSLLAIARLAGPSAEADRAARFSDLFVDILGHDLRNPLSAISTAANVLQLRADSDRIAKPAGRIVNSVERMERMIAQLLDFTRIRLGGGVPLSRSDVDLQEVARDVIAGLEPVHRREVRLDVTGDPTGTWDRGRLSQVLSNLVGNACRFATDGTAVGIRIEGERPEVVRVEVTNEGAIPPDLLPVLFEPLRSTGERRVKRDGSSGLGLGLYITRKITIAHGGEIGVTSTEEAGTRFRVSLPRQAGNTRTFGSRGTNSPWSNET